MPTALAPGQHVFDHVLGLGHAADADDRDFDLLGDLIDHPQHDRLQGRRHQPAELVAERGPEIVGPDLQRQERVGDHQRNRRRRLPRLARSTRCRRRWARASPTAASWSWRAHRRDAVARVVLVHREVAAGLRCGSGTRCSPRSRRHPARSALRRARQNPRCFPTSTLTISGGLNFAYSGTMCSMKYSMPLPGSPIDWMMPASVSAMRGVGLPSRGSRQIVLATSAAEPVEIDDVVVFPGERARTPACTGFCMRDVADLDRKIYHPTASCMLKTGPSRQTRLSTRLPSTSKVRMQT